MVSYRHGANRRCMSRALQSPTKGAIVERSAIPDSLGDSNMSKFLSLAAAAMLFTGLSFVVADEATDKVTLEGEGLCAKCALAETDECQNALIVTKDGKKTTYYMAKNDVAKKAHGSVGFCGAKVDKTVKVKVVGTVKKVDDKMVLTAEKITKVVD
jgi:hypothetical protein